MQKKPHHILALCVPAITSLAAACGLQESGQLNVVDGGAADVVAPDGGGPDSEPAPDSGVDAVADAAVDGPPVPTSPDQVPALQFWLRGDKGVVASTDGGLADGGPIATWKDSSSVGDPNRDAKSASATAPLLNPANSTYAGRPTVHFEDYAILQTGTFSVPLAQPATVLVVGNTSAGGARGRYFLDSLKPSFPFAIYAAGTNNVGAPLDTLQLSAPFDTTIATPTATSPVVVIAIVDGTKSSITVSGIKTGASPGTGGTTGFTIGNWAGGTLWATKGDIAEVAVWSRALTAKEVAQLNLYAGPLYGITIN